MLVITIHILDFGLDFNFLCKIMRIMENLRGNVATF